MGTYFGGNENMLGLGNYDFCTKSWIYKTYLNSML